MSKLGINGFGRIGRLVLRRLLEVDSSLEVVAINDLTSPKVLAYLLKHDSNYGPFPWSVDFTEDALIVNGKTITVYAEKEAQHIPWQAAGAEVIVECTGFLHLGREIAGPSPGRRAQSADFRPRWREMKTIVYNVNDDTLTPDDTIISVASCTTNCLAPMAKVLQGCLRHHRGHHDHHPCLYRHPVAGGRAARQRSARLQSGGRKRHPAHHRCGKGHRLW